MIAGFPARRRTRPNCATRPRKCSEAWQNLAVSPIATHSLRIERVTVGEALRRLGRFWWIWIALGRVRASTISVWLVFTGYIVVLGDFCATLPESQDVVAVWRLALRLVGATVAGLAMAVVFGGGALLFQQTEGVTVWSIGLGAGLIVSIISSIAALLMTARGTAHTRQGFEPRFG